MVDAMKLRVGGLAVAVAATAWLACSGTGGGKASGFVNCANDDQCPADQGCQVDTPVGDGYCSPLCTTNAACPGKIQCPNQTEQRAGDCDDVGKHKGGQGACEQFTNSRGPNTCSSVISNGGDSGISTDGGTGTDAR